MNSGFNSLQVGYKRATWEYDLPYDPVSIPYRLATNSPYPRRRDYTDMGFNSLQVGYKPGILLPIVTNLLSFNSLQVGYKRLQVKRLGVTKLQFQFLIGWLQTKISLFILSTILSVSIPYRLATNLNLTYHTRFFSPCVSIPYRLATNRRDSQPVRRRGNVSIPYRLATNTISELEKMIEEYSFNSLQVGYKLSSQPKRRLHSKVSIPYRLATNLSASLNDGCTPKFQFLIGWLQTVPDVSFSRSNSKVSIPYRLATNKSDEYLCYFQYEKFQFLIGWLQTLADLLRDL